MIQRGGHRRGHPGAGQWLSVVRTASGGMLRHKVQAVVIVAVLFIATASATLGLALLNANNSPFTKAFAAQRGADVTVTANSGRATAAQLAATRHVGGVTALAGPFATTSIPLEFQGQPWGQTTLVGRSDPGGPVDDLVLNAGHWADGPGQVVLDLPAPGSGPGNGGLGNGGPVLGSTFTATSLPSKPVLTVVGFANSVTGTAAGGGGWVTPAELSSLLPLSSQPTAQLLYGGPVQPRDRRHPRHHGERGLQAHQLDLHQARPAPERQRAPPRPRRPPLPGRRPGHLTPGQAGNFRNGTGGTMAG